MLSDIVFEAVFGS